jgi:hypothetical protein
MTVNDPMPHSLDPRVPIIAQMAAVIYAEKVVFNSNREARRIAVDESFLLYGDIVIRLSENDR